MATRQIKPSFQVITCGFCHRTLLRGERSDSFFLDGEERISCELCQPTALRGGWRRERGTQVRSTRPAIGGASLLDRLRHRSAPPAPRRVPQPPPRRVTAQPTGPAGRIKVALDEFNASPVPTTISGIANSLGEPVIAVTDHNDQGVDVVAAWELCWYRWRVELGAGGATILERERGSELDDLPAAEREGNARAETDGTIHLLG